MNRFNREVLKDLNDIFTAKGLEKDLLLADMIRKTNQLIQTEEDNGVISISLDLETAECVYIYNGTGQIHERAMVFGSFINIICEKALSSVNDLSLNDLNDAMKDSPAASLLDILFEENDNREGFLNELKTAFMEITEEELKKGFKKGMARETIKGR